MCLTVYAPAITDLWVYLHAKTSYQWRQEYERLVVVLLPSVCFSGLNGAICGIINSNMASDGHLWNTKMDITSKLVVTLSEQFSHRLTLLTDCSRASHAFLLSDICSICWPLDTTQYLSHCHAILTETISSGTWHAKKVLTSSCSSRSPSVSKLKTDHTILQYYMCSDIIFRQYELSRLASAAVPKKTDRRTEIPKKDAWRLFFVQPSKQMVTSVQVPRMSRSLDTPAAILSLRSLLMFEECRRCDTYCIHEIELILSLSLYCCYCHLCWQINEIKWHIICRW